MYILRRVIFIVIVSKLTIINPITVSLLGAESAPLMYLLLQLIQKLMA